MHVIHLHSQYKATQSPLACLLELQVGTTVHGITLSEPLDRIRSSDPLRQFFGSGLSRFCFLPASDKRHPECLITAYGPRTWLSIRVWASRIANSDDLCAEQLHRLRRGYSL